jgi:hypothetical protein
MSVNNQTVRQRYRAKAAEVLEAGAEDTLIFKLERLFGPIVVGLVGPFFGVIIVGFVLGTAAHALGWARPPSQAFFLALAGLGGALLIAFTVVGTQLLPTISKLISTSDTSNVERRELALRTIYTLPSAFAAVGLVGVVGIGTCLAMVDAPLSRSHWWLMALTGISVFTVALVAVMVCLASSVVAMLSSALAD